MSVIGAVKAATIALTLGIGAAEGGLGLGYVVQNDSFGVFRGRNEKEPVVVPKDSINNAEKGSSNPNQRDLKDKVAEPKISFDAEVIYGKSHGNYM
ncbi:hypothetical protein MSUIS_01550 [Mycoplasma suis KI3806]|uniref:Uncharacterized protein n=1 Tax=Mycoplasma suis (strain KI_3806) TaxID=708248 RepID=F0V326_MYCS3|nr:hypothetical protein [Mycoplasma suis]CBZ40248.1 hypothetical protein MSUIS_01550 [Mycoplasma suis KI3806]